MATREQDVPRDPDRRRKLWKLYAHSRKLVKEEDADYQRVNQMVIDAAKQYEIYSLTEKDSEGNPMLLPGIMSLQQELGIDADFDEPTSGMDRARGRMAMLAQGATLQGADEVLGAVDAVRQAIPPYNHLIGAAHGERGYEEGRDRIRDRQDRARAERPVESLALEMTGMAAPAIATGGVASGAMGQGGLLARSIQGGATMGALGAAEAGAYGALGSDEPTVGGRLKEGAVSGAVGGGMGGILGAAGPWLAAIGRQGLRAGEAIGVPGARTMRSMSARRAAETQLRGLLSDYDLSPEQVAEAINKMPQGSVVADYAEGFAETAQAARKAGRGDLALPGSPAAQIKMRDTNKGDRAVAALRGGTGIERVQNPDDLVKLGVAAWKDEVEAPFLSQMSDMTFGSTRIRRMLKDNDMLASVLHRNGVDVGDVRKNQTLRVEDGWDAIKDFTDMLRPKADGTSRLSQRERRQAMAAVDELKEIMEEAVPGFSKMRADYARIHERARQYDAGRKARTKPAREVAAAIREAGEQAQAYREGLMDAWEEQILLSPNTIHKLVDGSEWLNRVRNLFPEGSVGNRAFFEFTDNMLNEQRWNNTFRAIKGKAGPGAYGSSDELGAVITRMPSLVNEVISLFISDPHRNPAAQRVANILLSEGPEAMVRAAIRAEHTALQGAVGRGATLLGTTKMGGAAADEAQQSGILSSPQPVQAARGLLPPQHMQ